MVLEGAGGLHVACPAEKLDGLRAWLRVLTAAWLAGVAEQVLELTVGYVAERRQFGRAVAGFQAVQHCVADMTADVHAMGNLISFTLTQLDRETGTARHEAALAVKAHVSQTCLAVCESALQMHGGIGFTTEYPLHRYYKSAIALRPFYGEPEDLFSEIGRGMVR